MQLRFRGVAATAATMLMLTLSLPVHAQDAARTVSLDGVGFSFDRALGTSVNISQVPGQSPTTQQIDAPQPPHLAFTLYGRRAEEKRIPRPIDAPGVVRFYRTADLAPYDLQAQQLARLQTLLSERPDPATLKTIGADGSVNPLPFVVDFAAAQAIVARVGYVDTPELSGVAYLTVFRQDVYPFTAGDFWYTFQGLSTDGTWYVSADFVITASMFPTKLDIKDANRISSSAKRWAQYLRTSLATLDGADPSAFKPPLTSIDALVQSITFGGVPSIEPTPLPSTAPSVVPSAAP